MARRISFFKRERLFRAIVDNMVIIHDLDLEWARAYAAEAMLCGLGAQAADSVCRELPMLVVRNVEKPRPVSELRPWERALVD